MQEAGRLPSRAEEFAEDTGGQIAFSYIIGLFQNDRGRTPSADTAADYWETVGEPEFAVTADITQRLLSATPYRGNSLPGKCVLTPDMVMLECVEGEADDDWAFDAIREHAGI